MAETSTDTQVGKVRSYDGWCVYSAVMCEAEMGNVPLHGFPTYVPPGAHWMAPYGVAGANCPYGVLPVGKGVKPVIQFTDETSHKDAILQLLAFSHEGKICTYTD